MQKKYTFIITLALSLLTLPVYALDFIYTKNSLWGSGSEGNKYAIEGYDAVSYFTEGKSVKGNKQFNTLYKDKEWHFSSAKNRDLFVENPQQYAPQYGGHCAWRMAIDGEGVYGNAKIWKIVDNKLYLNYNEEVSSRWNKDIPGFISKANDYWLKEHKFPSLN